MPWIATLPALAALAATSARPLEPPAPHVAPPIQDAQLEPPRLVVLVAVDQLRPDQLERLAPWFEGGFARLQREGLVFRTAMLDYAATETGPGHATLGTGCLPRTHGVTGNGIWMTDACEECYCCDEPGARRVTSRGVLETKDPRGPAMLLAPTLAETIRAAHPEAKVVSIAGKDRSAIGLAGKVAGTVVWWDRGDGGFESSTAFASELPPYVLDWNAGWVAGASGWRWEPLAADGLERAGTAADDRPGEAVFGPFGRGFPYELHRVTDPLDPSDVGRLAALAYGSPLVDRFVAELALAALEREGLGADDVPDLLALSFSACDTVGHSNGPFSREVTDLVLRLDRLLGELLDAFDAKVGEGRWILALSADHGVLPLPEHESARLVGARRVGAGELRATREAIRAALDEELGPGTGRAVERRFSADGLALDRAKVAELGHDLARVRAIARDAAQRSIGAGSWLAAAYTYDELAAPEEPLQFGAKSEPPLEPDPWRALFVNSFHRGRSLDVVLRNAPWTLVGRGTGTSHGSCYPYDRAVPLVFVGHGVRGGVRSDAAGSQDAVPTLLTRLGLPPLAPLDGRDLLAD